MSDLNGKNIIVTGASGGIGNSIIKKLYQNGANILASGTRIEKLNELKDKLLINIFLIIGSAILAGVLTFLSASKISSFLSGDLKDPLTE